MLSPTVASFQDKNKKIIYLNPRYEILADVIIKNIINKYQTIFMENFPYKIKIKFDNDYLEANWVKGNITKLISIKVGAKTNAKIKAFMLPLTIETDKVDHKLIYDAGFGEKNSLGFGMLEVAHNNQENLILSKFSEKNLIKF